MHHRFLKEMESLLLAFSTLRIFYTPHYPHSALRTPRPFTVMLTDASNLRGLSSKSPAILLAVGIGAIHSVEIWLKAV